MAETDGRSTSPPPSPDDGPEEGHGGKADRPVSLAQDALRASAAMVSGLLGGALLGFGIDRLTGSDPWGLVSGALAGTAAGVWRLWRMTAGIDRRGADTENGGSEGDAPDRDF